MLLVDSEDNNELLGNKESSIEFGRARIDFSIHTVKPGIWEDSHYARPDLMQARNKNSQTLGFFESYRAGALPFGKSSVLTGVVSVLPNNTDSPSFRLNQGDSAFQTFIQLPEKSTEITYMRATGASMEGFARSTIISGFDSRVLYSIAVFVDRAIAAMGPDFHLTVLVEDSKITCAALRKKAM